MKLEILVRQLDEIEAEMRHLGLIADPAQPLPEIKSAFGYGQVSFEQWLSGVFLPKARAAIEVDELPSDSQVGVAAMRNFDGDDRMNDLVSLLSAFDQSVRRYARSQAGPVSAKSASANWLRKLLRNGGQDA